ncbi:sugar transferase [Campylobacter novaezeelandiae]|uniref:Sugar transferase n=1 Tax=Campylobacter novaezeelandiae TaxID=2267891 RepID=A0A4Q9JUG5_9BACT|nr:sugar transferase [Campylobacter novaezeelandiae]TBR81295.1 sugar transferase [Campylobacter novaezeelandiae]
MTLLSVIIPFGLSKERLYIQDRIFEKIEDFKDLKEIEFIFVEGYSSLKNNLKEKIIQNNYIYLKDDSQINFFSQGKCRNLGASFASSSVIMFLDVDCYLSKESFLKILNLIKIKNISLNLNALLVLPVVYLTQEASNSLKKQDQSLWDSLIQNDLISGKNTYVKFFAPSSTSSIVINKHTFLKLGGNDERFIGHSYEDFDLFARILKSCIEFEKMPSNLNYDSRNWNFYNFEGFRSWFSLLGYEACFYGIYMYHFWHIEPNQNGYMDRRHRNHKLFYKNLKNMQTHSLKPLQVFQAKNEKVLILFKDKNYDFKDVSIYIGEIIYKNINDFIDKELKYELLLDFLQQEKITKVFLDANIEYKMTNIKHLDVFYFQKGILPDSWYFYKDLQKHYEKREWDRKLSNEEKLQIYNYLLTLSHNDKKNIKQTIEKLNIDMEKDLLNFVFYLKNKLYSFTYRNDFFQIILDKERYLIAEKNDKSFYCLHSFIYKPYLFELKNIQLFSFVYKILGLSYLKAKISQTKFYRLLRKWLFNFNYKKKGVL